MLGVPPEVDGDLYDGPLLIEDQDVLNPGEVATVRLHPVAADLLARGLRRAVAGHV